MWLGRWPNPWLGTARQECGWNSHRGEETSPLGLFTALPPLLPPLPFQSPAELQVSAPSSEAELLVLKLNFQDEEQNSQLASYTLLSAPDHSMGQHPPPPPVPNMTKQNP